MKAFRVFFNGELLYTIGIGNHGVLNANVCWVGDPGSEGDLVMHVGGLDSSADEHARWPVPDLRVGDEMSIQVVETDEIDPPATRYKG